LHSSWSVVAPHYPGVYEVEWQLVRRTEPIGSRLWLSLVVVPEGEVEGGLKEQFESRLAEWHSRAGVERNWRILRLELEREIRRTVETELRMASGGKDGQLGASIEAEIRARWIPILRQLAW
jgi:hypothetical protein